MESKHTEGPWELRDVVGSGLEIWARVDLGKSRCEQTDLATGPYLQPIYEVSIEPQLRVGKDGTVEAHICYESWRQFPSINFQEMQRANAKLITASPEMADSLFRLTNELVGMMNMAEPEIRAAVGNTNYSVLLERVAEAKTALAKAGCRGKL